MTKQERLPKRKPDFYLHFNELNNIEGWQQEDHWIVRYIFKDKEIIIALRGIFNLKESGSQIKYSIEKAINEELALTGKV